MVEPGNQQAGPSSLFAAASTSSLKAPVNTTTSSSSASTSSSQSFVSFRDVFEHLELARRSRPADELQSILTSRKAKLKSCLQPFPPASTSSSVTASDPPLPPKALKLPDGSTHTLTEQQQRLCRDIVQKYNLSNEEAFIQLQTFLSSDDRDLDALSIANVTSSATSGPASPSKLRTTKRKDTLSRFSNNAKPTPAEAVADLLDAFNIFYFEERMYLLRTISSLIRITEDAQHDYFSLANSVLALFADESFARECLNHFHALVDYSLPDSIRQQPRYSSLWAKQILREQFGLLEIVFLLFYGRLAPSPSSVLHFLTTIQQTEVGRRQANLGFFDEEASETVVCIGHLLILTGIEMLGLEEAMDGIDLSATTEASIVRDPAALGEALDKLENTALDSMQSPLLLAWSLVLHRLEEALVACQEQSSADAVADLPETLLPLADVVRTEDGGPPVWRRLAQAAFAPEMQLFEMMMSMLASPLLTSSNGASTPAVAGPSALAYRAVFKGLLLSITELVKPEFLPNFDALVSLWEATFGAGIALELSPSAIDGVAALCDQFWQIDSRYESRCTTLDTARRRWPVSFRPLVRLMKALSGHARVDALGSWPSLLDDKPRSEIEERACAAVFDFLSSLPTFAQVLPMAASAPGAPFETMEGGDYTSVTYRITRPMRVPGTQVRLAPGTIGSTISELGKAPVIVLWSPTRPISAWKLMRDVLSSFPPPFPGQAGPEPDAKVFQDDLDSMNFARLAPAEAQASWEDLASEMLDLFTSVVSASPTLAWSLLAHLEGRDLGVDDASMEYEPEDLEQIQEEKQELAHAKSLSSISLSLLSHALVASPINTRLVQSAYKMLTVLLPYESDAVWQEVRSSNALFGSPGALSYLSNGQSGAASRMPSSSVLLTHEMARASYGGLLSLLDFHIALFFDLRRSYSMWSTETLKMKASVLLRSLSWVFECVWPEYQSWKYTRLADRLEIGQKCTLLLEIVLSERSWQLAQIPQQDLIAEPGPAADLVEAVERSLISQPSMLGLAPLITCLGNGQQLLDQLNRAGRQTDAILAEQWISSSLRLASLIVSRRREMTIATLQKLSTLPAETAKKAVSARVDLGLFEKLFFDHTIVASRSTYGATRKSSRIELANAIFGYVLLPTSSQINSQAAHLITVILRSVADLSSIGKQTPGLIGHLGTLAELEGTIGGMVELVDNAHQDTGLRVKIWTMLAALVDTQPALGTLLLTGRHLAKTTESRLTDTNSKQSEGNKTLSSSEATRTLNFGQALSRTALDVAADAILKWKEISETEMDAELLEAVLRFLDVAWAHAAEHVVAFDAIRTKIVFFQALADLVAQSFSAPSTEPRGFVDGLNNALSQGHEEMAAYAYRRMCQARALRLLERDIQLGNLLKDQGKSPSASGASLKVLVSLLQSSDKLLQSIENSFTMPCDPSRRMLLELKLAEYFPTINLESLRHPARKDDFDTERRYGQDYHYSIDSFQRKLEGLLGSTDHEEIRELGVVEEGLLWVMAINLEWSCIDVQNSLLQAWKQCLETTMGRVMAEAISSKQTFAQERSVITAWTRFATIAADEGREGDFMRGVHATRLSLLSTLMELAWGHGEAEGASSEDQIVQAATLCGRLLGHPMLSVEESIKGTLAPSFHRYVYEMVLICIVRIRSLLKKNKAIAQPNDKTIESHRALHGSIDLFCRHTVQALRITTENAMRCVQRGQIQSEAAQTLEEELDMLTSMFEMTIRRDMGAEVGVWLPMIQESQLLQLTIDLLSRAPVLRFDSNTTGEVATNPNSTHHVLFMPSLLSLLLTIASQPASSEELALQGVVNGLTSNMLSDHLEEGGVNALLLSGERNPSHECWTMMLQIVVQLIDNLGGGSDLGNWGGTSGRFIETDMHGFMRVYQKQIDNAMTLESVQRRLNSMSGSFGMAMQEEERHKGLMSNEMLSLGQLEELEMVSRLFYSLTRSEDDASGDGASWRGASRNGSKATTRSMAQHLADKTVSVLPPLVHLLQHPRELNSLLGWEEGTQDSQEMGKTALSKMREIVSILVSGLWMHTRCETVLCREAPAWPSTQSGCALVRPTTRTSAVGGATLGTLLDLAAYLTDHIRSSNKKEKVKEGDEDEADRLRSLEALEQTSGLVATQTAIWANGKSKANESEAQLEQAARQELEAGIWRDMMSTIRSAEEVVTENVNLLGVIKTFVESKLTRAAF